MSSRKPIYVMLAVGLAIILLLTYVPYSLLARAGRAITSLVVFTQPADIPPPPSAPTPAFDVASWYAGRGEDSEVHGVLVESIDGAQVLASHNADKLFNPASIIKLATALAVLRSHGAGHRFETRVYTVGTLDGKGALRGSVVVAGADPVFGDASASLIARELRARGVQSVSGEILVTPGFCFNYSESSEDSAGRMAKVMQLREKATGVGDAPPGKPLFVVKSHTLREIILYMNAHSSNFVAERLGTLVGGPQGLERFLVDVLNLPAEQVVIQRASGREHNRMTARGTLAVIRRLKEEAERQGLKLEDLMPVASDDAGTLRRRFEGTPLEGATLGKTGTLTAEVDGGMASLAGVVYTEKAGMVVFAVFNQGSRIAENRETEDALLSQVVVSLDTPRLVSRPEERRRLLPPASLVVEPQALAGLPREDDEHSTRKVVRAEPEEKPEKGQAREPKKTVRQTSKQTDRPRKARGGKGR